MCFLSIIEKKIIWKESNQNLQFKETSIPDLSTISKFSNSDNWSKRRSKKYRQYNLNTISLIDLLKKYKAPRIIDYLSIDTEGSEFEILKNFNLIVPNGQRIGIVGTTGAGKTTLVKSLIRYFDIQNLSEMFSYLTDKGYTVIYKRPINDEFVLDSNEQLTLEYKLSLVSNIENLGLITDFELCKYFNNKVLNLNDLQKQYNLDYNTLQLKLFSESEGFITMNGGGGILCAYFDKPVVKYVNKGKELRPMYLEYPDSYINKLSDAKIYPVYDNIVDWKKNGGRNYNKLLSAVQSIFK